MQQDTWNRIGRRRLGSIASATLVAAAFTGAVAADEGKE